MPNNLFRKALQAVLKEDLTEQTATIADLLNAYQAKTAGYSSVIDVFRDRGNGVWDGGYANGWEKETYDLLNALKPYMIDSKTTEIGRSRRKTVNTYEDSTGTYTLVSMVDSGD